MKIYKNIFIFIAAFSLYSCGSDFNGFYRQTADSKHKTCVVKNKEKIEAIEAQCVEDGQRGCRKLAVTWVCENKWRNY